MDPRGPGSREGGSLPPTRLRRRSPQRGDSGIRRLRRLRVCNAAMRPSRHAALPSLRVPRGTTPQRPPRRLQRTSANFGERRTHDGHHKLPAPKVVLSSSTAPKSSQPVSRFPESSMPPVRGRSKDVSPIAAAYTAPPPEAYPPARHRSKFAATRTCTGSCKLLTVESCSGILDRQLFG